ncbi:MAG: DUF1127 domain-containing protein [Rhodobacteraceae bacterium]|nr:MAG: DUF1127 domain-containing protein [Paracoccaceae bacterium]
MIAIWSIAFRTAAGFDCAPLGADHGDAAVRWERARRAVAGVFERLAEMRRLARSRRALSALDDRLLADVGLDRDTALREARRGFWDGREGDGAYGRRR